MEKLGTTKKLAGYGYVFDCYVREVSSLVTSLDTFHGWRGNLVQETLFVTMQTKAAS